MRLRINPTRMMLLRLRRRVEIARRGHKLLKDKLEGLIQKFFLTKKNLLALYEELEPLLVHTFTKAIFSSALSSIPVLPPVELLEAQSGFNQILPKLTQMAALNKSLKVLADQIIETRRRVNALEYILIPELERNLKIIRFKLSELERSTQAVLLKVVR